MSRGRVEDIRVKIEGDQRVSRGRTEGDKWDMDGRVGE